MTHKYNCMSEIMLYTLLCFPFSADSHLHTHFNTNHYYNSSNYYEKLFEMGLLSSWEFHCVYFFLYWLSLYRYDIFFNGKYAYRLSYFKFFCYWFPHDLLVGVCLSWLLLMPQFLQHGGLVYNWGNRSTSEISFGDLLNPVLRAIV